MTMFYCERMRAKLMKSGCARLYESALARRPDPHESRHHCIACPVGALHAGKPIAATRQHAEVWRSICSRCLKASDRLIRRQLCVSCFNRTREALIGKNAKGTRPKLTDVLHDETIMVIEAAAVRTHVATHVVSAAEVMVGLAKAANDRVAFAWGRSHAS